MAGCSTKPFSAADETGLKQESALMVLGQTTRFGHVGAHHQLSLSRALPAVFDGDSPSAPLGVTVSEVAQFIRDRDATFDFLKRTNVALDETLGLHGALRAYHSFWRRRDCLGLALRKREIAFRLIGGFFRFNKPGRPA